MDREEAAVSIRSRIRPRYKAHLIHKYRDEPEAVVWPTTRFEERLIEFLWRCDDWCAPEPWMIRMAVDLLGVTEADVRDVRRKPNYDVLIVRLWNWRKLEITGREFVKWQ